MSVVGLSVVPVALLGELVALEARPGSTVSFALSAQASVWVTSMPHVEWPDATGGGSRSTAPREGERPPRQR